MSNEELLVAILVGLVVLFLIKKFWRLILGLGVIAVLLVAGMCLAGEECPLDRGPGGGSQGSGGGVSSPADQEVINTVYQDVQGKTYTHYEVQYRQVRTPCTEAEDKTDWGKGDPNRGKCRGTGGYGYGYKTENRQERVPVTRSCPIPPLPSDPAWRIQPEGHHRWLVYNPQGRWTVEYDGSHFQITPHQPC